MAETAEQQRARILSDPWLECEPWEYDLAIALGYEPESWDGMWRLPVHPFTIHNGYAIVREVVAPHHGPAKIVRGRINYRVRTYKAPATAR